MATQIIQTAAAPYSLSFQIETATPIAADGQDVALISVAVLDKNVSKSLLNP